MIVSLPLAIGMVRTISGILALLFGASNVSEGLKLSLFSSDMQDVEHCL